jgi:hypothetical protein
MYLDRTRNAPNNRIQATAGGLTVLNSHVGRSPAARDAER